MAQTGCRTWSHRRGSKCDRPWQARRRGHPHRPRRRRPVRAALRRRGQRAAGHGLSRRDGRLLALDSLDEDEAAVRLPMRALVARALALDAAALVIAHNHPSGDPNAERRGCAAHPALRHGLRRARHHPARSSDLRRRPLRQLPAARACSKPRRPGCCAGLGPRPARLERGEIGFAVAGSRSKRVSS